MLVYACILSCRKIQKVILGDFCLTPLRCSILERAGGSNKNPLHVPGLRGGSNKNLLYQKGVKLILSKRRPQSISFFVKIYLFVVFSLHTPNSQANFFISFVSNCQVYLIMKIQISFPKNLLPCFDLVFQISSKTSNSNLPKNVPYSMTLHTKKILHVCVSNVFLKMC